MGHREVDQDAQLQMFSLAGPAAVPQWIKHPHAPKQGYEPLEVYQP